MYGIATSFMIGVRYFPSVIIVISINGSPTTHAIFKTLIKQINGVVLGDRYSSLMPDGVVPEGGNPYGVAGSEEPGARTVGIPVVGDVAVVDGRIEFGFRTAYDGICIIMCDGDVGHADVDHRSLGGTTASVTSHIIVVFTCGFEK